MKNHQNIKCEVKYNYAIIIVRMPEEMRAALNKSFAPRHYKMKGDATAKNQGVFRKIKSFLFLRFGYCRPFERCPGQISPMLSF